VNTDAPWPGLDEARARVLKIQTKLHQWATDSPDRRFDDLFNLVCDPAFLTVGWDRVRGNRGARTAGVDRVKPRAIGRKDGEAFLRELRDDLKARRFSPLPVRERMIPKASGKLRRLGIPTARDRAVQASLKLVLEPIFEADFHPCSYGFRPMRRAHDAIEEIRHFSRLSYEWVLEGDIASCFDEISHVGLLDRVRDRVADKRVSGLVKAFLIAGILTEDGAVRGTKTGTPQGGILSPLLANIALSVLDEHFAEAWETTMANDYDRRRRRRRGEPMYRLVRYADDFVVLVSGTEAQAEALKVDVAAVLSTMGLRLSVEKTGVCHIDDGFVFLGFRIQRQRKRGASKVFVYSWPSKKALASIMAKIKAITRQGTNQPLSIVLRQINAALRGWTVYFRHGVSKQTFAYLNRYTWLRVAGWLRRKHCRAPWKTIRRRYLALPGNRLVPHDGGVALFNAESVPIVRYRYRGTKIPTPWTERPSTTQASG
jgi:RNA-directed DNA polymerase